MYISFATKNAFTYQKGKALLHDLLTGQFAVGRPHVNATYDYWDIVDESSVVLFNDNVPSWTPIEAPNGNRYDPDGLQAAPATHYHYEAPMGDDGHKKFLTVHYVSSWVYAGFNEDPANAPSGTIAPLLNSETHALNMSMFQYSSGIANSRVHMYITNDCIAIYNEYPTTNACSFISEYVPQNAWDKPSNGYAQVVQAKPVSSTAISGSFSNGSNTESTAVGAYDIKTPHFPNPKLGGKIEEGASAGAFFSVGGIAREGLSFDDIIGADYAAGRTLTSNLSLMTQAAPIGFGNRYKGHKGGSITAKSGIYLLPKKTGWVGDIVKLNGKQYTIWPGQNNNCFAIPLE